MRTGTHRMKTGATSAAVRSAGALLCLAVAVIHLIDQGGVPGSKTPTYVGIGYWVLEIVAVIGAIALLARPASRPTWATAVAVGAGPFLGYLLSRGPGLPDYSDDIGNWAEPLGVLSLAVELLLIALSVAALLRISETQRGQAALASRPPRP